MQKLYLLLITVLLLISGCSSAPEGTSDGDCSDSKDNDKDGFIDCEDDGCNLDDHCLDLAAKALAAQEKARADKDAAAAKPKSEENKLPYIVMDDLWIQKQLSPEDINWAQADKYCNNLVLAEKTDWRLPTDTEAFNSLRSKEIVKESFVMWTSSKKNNKRALIVGISTGAINELGVHSKGQCRARCVRDNK
jgi:uncharacterized protein YceK